MDDHRQYALEKVAFNLELQWFGKDTERTLPFLHDFRLFNRGRRKRIYNLMQGRNEMLDTDVRIFDYHYSTRSNNYHRRHKQTVFFVQSQTLGLPELYLRPEHFLHRVGEYLNLTKDIDFESFPAFSKHYRLRGADEDFIRATLNEDVLHFFSFNKKWWFEGVNYYFILYRPEKLIAPGKMERFYNMGNHLMRMLKADFP